VQAHEEVGNFPQPIGADQRRKMLPSRIARRTIPFDQGSPLDGSSMLASFSARFLKCLSIDVTAHRCWQSRLYRQKPNHRNQQRGLSKKRVGTRYRDRARIIKRNGVDIQGFQRQYAVGQVGSLKQAHSCSIRFTDHGHEVPET